MSDTLGLYIHIPFCASKCAYCDFYSLPGDADFKRYADALILHMEDYSAAASDRVIDSVFIGGGTPTVMPPKQLARIIEGVYSNFTVLDNAEFTVEANPATVDTRTLRALRRSGVNRLSLGLQSASNSELEALSRIHSFEDFKNTFESARKAGFKNINVDIMYGIPNQTAQSFNRTLDAVCALRPEHISMYGLKIEPGTPFGKMQDSLELPDESTEFAMYESAVEYLERQGYHQYEISNFARDGYECAHNLKYWNCMEYIGLGPAAHSYFNGNRFSFKRDAELYMSTLESVSPKDIITDEFYEISQSERLGEYIMLRMRLNEGVIVRDFNSIFGLDFDEIYGDFLKPYIDGGFVSHQNGAYAFTVKGKFVSNYILSSMLDFDGEIANNISKGTDK